MANSAVNLTVLDLGKSAWGTVAFALFALAPGYCAGWISNAFGFRKQSMVERGLWSVALSLPISLYLSANLTRFVAAQTTLRCFEAMGLAALALVAWEWTRRTRTEDAGLVAAGQGQFGWSREATIVAVSMAGVAAYCLLSVVGVQVGHKLFESSVAQDWGVRMALVASATRSPVPPPNPFFAVAGHAMPLRYYFYWYELCAQVIRITGIDAKAALAASCVWSAFALVAVVLLCFKHHPASRLAALLSPGQQARRFGVNALLTGCVLGLDVVPAIAGLFLNRRRLYPDIEFWHDDRSPSWLGSFLWAPHHVAGLVCCVVGLLCVLAIQRGMRLRAVAIYIALAAVSFSAALGTSTFIAAFFLLIGAMLLVERLWRREWMPAGALLATGAVCALLSVGFLHDLRSSAATAASKALSPSSGPGGAKLANGPSARSNRVLALELRNSRQAKAELNYLLFGLRHVYAPHHATLWQLGLRGLYMLGFQIAELGFFLFVLIYQFRTDFRSGRPLARDALLWWIVFAGFAMPGLFLTSGGLQGNNDLGRHAGLCMRFILLLWATPMVERYLRERREGEPHRQARPWVLRLAVATFFLGLAAQAWQIVILRTYLPLVDAGKIASTLRAQRFPQIARRYFDFRQGIDAGTEDLAPEAIVQGNPTGRSELLVSLYSHRQMAAVDDGCAAPFGGDPALCPAVAQPLIRLFGGTGMMRHAGTGALIHVALDPAMVTPAALAAVCREQKLSALVATYTDPVWSLPGSWVWTMQPLAANRSVRVIACPSTP